jgi:gliding motility-associated-like protein
MLNAPVTTDLITWQDGSHGSTFIADQAQLYSLEISNQCGIVRDEVLIIIDQQEPVVELGPDQTICAEQQLVMDVTQGLTASYVWSTGSVQPSIVITHPDIYAVTVSTDCYTVADDIAIQAADDCDSGIYISNVFTPNGDGINDVWEVQIDPSLQLSGIQCRVFGRWGDLVFETESVPVSWGGVMNGKVVAPGVFVYVLKYEVQGGETRIMSGDITLIR